MLQEKHHHDHEAGAAAHGHDHNLKAAYLHVLADALTSLLAILALFTGKAFGWVWMDPLMGIVGALIITRWAYGLMRDTGRILLDRDVEPRMVSEITALIEAEADNRVADLHVWRVGAHSLSVIVSIVTHHPQAARALQEAAGRLRGDRACHRGGQRVRGRLLRETMSGPADR